MSHFRKKTKFLPAVKAVDISGTPIMPLTINRYQAAALVGCDVKTIDRAIAAKKLKAARLGDRVLVNYASLVEAMG